MTNESRVWSFALLSALAACGPAAPAVEHAPRSSHAVAMPATADTPTAPVATASASAGSVVPSSSEPAVGAVPIPGVAESGATPNHEIDASVRFEELPAANARWGKRARLRHAGRVLIALNIASHDHLQLSVVNTEDDPRSGLPGTLDTFSLGPVDDSEYPRGGNAYPPRNAYEYSEGGYVGPIRFAIRSRPRADAEPDRRQVVVYVVGHSLLVAERRLVDTAWVPRLRLDFPRASELVAINPGWH